MIHFKNIKKKFKSIKGNSLAEFAVTTAMMATLATTAAPRFSGIGEGAKEKKTLSEIDKIVIASSNFFNNKVTTEGRGRFPGQEKYDVQIGGYASEIQLLAVIGGDAPAETSFDGYDNSEGSNWRSIFGTNDASAGVSAGSNVVDDDGSLIGHNEFLAEFASNAIKSPYQDGHYIYVIIPGYGTGVDTKSPKICVADAENPKVLHKFIDL